MFNKIIQGNHLDVLRRYPDDCFDMFLTSPPYDNLRDYEGYDFQFEPLAHELYRTLKPGGVGVWVVNDATINGSETLTSSKQKIYFREKCGFNIHDTMIYAKENPVPQTKVGRYTGSFEYMLILSKGKPLTVNYLEVVKTTKRKSVTTYGTKNKKGKRVSGFKTPCPYKTKIKTNIWYYIIGNNTKDFWNISAHPAIFPEKLAEDHILSWSNPGDVILDPMCGSGTSCKMAVKHQRRYLGIDCSEKYCELARERLDRFTAQSTIFDTIPAMN